MSLRVETQVLDLLMESRHDWCDAARKTEDLVRGFCDGRPHVGMPAVVRLRVQLADESLDQMDVSRRTRGSARTSRAFLPLLLSCSCTMSLQKASTLLKRSLTPQLLQVYHAGGENRQ